MSLLRDHQGLTDGKIRGVVDLGISERRRNTTKILLIATPGAADSKLQASTLDPTREVFLGSSEQPKLRTHLNRVFGGLPKRIARFRTRIGRRAKMQRIAPEQ